MKLLGRKVKKKENECFIYHQISCENDKSNFIIQKNRTLSRIFFLSLFFFQISLMLLLAEIVFKENKHRKRVLVFHYFHKEALSQTFNRS